MAVTGRTTGRSVASNTDVFRFVGLALLLSWSLWVLPLLRSTLVPDLPEIVGLLGVFAPFGPGVAAFVLVYRRTGRKGVRALWRRGFRVGGDRRWLVVALALMPALAAATVGIVLAVGGEIDWDAGVPAAMVVPVFLLILIGNAFPEEFGWRGYMLDPLIARHGRLPGSIVLGVVWAVWHLPLFGIDGTTQAEIPFIEFLAQTVVLAVVYTSLHLNTEGSVLIAALFHASANTAGAAVPTWTTTLGRWVGFVLLLLVAAVIVRGWSQGPTPVPDAA